MVFFKILYLYILEIPIIKGHIKGNVIFKYWLFTEPEIVKLKFDKLNDIQKPLKLKYLLFFLIIKKYNTLTGCPI